MVDNINIFFKKKKINLKGSCAEIGSATFCFPFMARLLLSGLVAWMLSTILIDEIFLVKFRSLMHKQQFRSLMSIFFFL